MARKGDYDKLLRSAIISYASIVLALPKLFLASQQLEIYMWLGAALTLAKWENVWIALF